MRSTMPQTAPPDRLIRLLVVTPQEGSPSLDVARLVACPIEMKWIRVATDCNDGLRLILMTYPDVIVLPWSAAAAKLLRVIDHLRNPRFSPQVVVVTELPAPPESLTLSDGVMTIGVDPLHPDGLTDSLRAMLADNGIRFQASGE
ncbi:MAG: hypothetical protein HC889_17605 [Synechococcaceae cyanobacterium SM1_2_3]|nr:hypothetical protein [Synechococcaceae cyanobacterium SM1_2_3]